MRYFLCFLLACLILISPALLSQDRPAPISLIQLIASPEKFDGKSVAVRGFFLVAGRPHDVVGCFLFLHKEDAENDLGNSIIVVPNEMMTKDQEKIDRMYIQLIGTFRAVHIAGTDAQVASIRDITSYTLWSDPAHPITLKLLEQKHK